MNNEDDDPETDPFAHLPEDHPSRDRDYGVGKFRPPVNGRVQPGERRNPRGRPPKAEKTPTQEIADFYREKVPVRVGNEVRQLPRFMAEQYMLSAKAMAGSIPALKESHARALHANVFPEITPVLMEEVGEFGRMLVENYLARRGDPSETSDEQEPDHGESE
jgi:hypothetical protein